MCWALFCSSKFSFFPSNSLSILANKSLLLLRLLGLKDQPEVGLQILLFFFAHCPSLTCLSVLHGFINSVEILTHGESLPSFVFPCRISELMIHDDQLVNPIKSIR